MGVTNLKKFMDPSDHGTFELKFEIRRNNSLPSAFIAT